LPHQSTSFLNKSNSTFNNYKHTLKSSHIKSRSKFKSEKEKKKKKGGKSLLWEMRIYIKFVFAFQKCFKSF